MTASDEINWRDVRRAYEGGAGSVNEICARFGIKSPQLYHRKRVENWVARLPRRVKHRSIARNLPSFRQASDELKRVLGAEISATREAPPTGAMPEMVQNPQVYITRIYGLVAHQISLIEARRIDFGNGREAQSIGDTERLSRTLSVLVRALEKLIVLEANIGAPIEAEQEGQAHLDAEQFRIELIRRMEKFECGGPQAVSEDPDAPGA